MKALKLFLVISLIASMLSVAVGATEFVPSAERPQNYEVVEVQSESDNSTRKLVIIPFHMMHHDELIDQDHHELHDEAHDEITEQIRESLKAAVADLEDELVHHLVNGFDEVWAKITGGAPLENHIVYDIFEAAWICSEEQAMIGDEKISFSFKVDGITKDDKIIIIHKPTDSEHWIIEEHEIDENGVITVHADKLSPFAIIKDSGKAPTTDVQSPQTGVSDTGLIVTAVSAVILAAGAVVIGKKLRKTTVQ